MERIGEILYNNSERFTSEKIKNIALNVYRQIISDMIEHSKKDVKKEMEVNLEKYLPEDQFSDVFYYTRQFIRREILRTGMTITNGYQYFIVSWENVVDSANDKNTLFSVIARTANGDNFLGVFGDRVKAESFVIGEIRKMCLPAVSFDITLEYEELVKKVDIESGCEFIISQLDIDEKNPGKSRYQKFI